MKFNQKRHAIIEFLKARTTAFWIVCSKETQKKYMTMPFSEENIDSVRDEICKLYLKGLENCHVSLKQVKTNYMTKKLLK